MDPIDPKFVFDMKTGELAGKKAILYVLEGANFFIVCFDTFDYPTHNGLASEFVQKYGLTADNLHEAIVYGGSVRGFFLRPKTLL